MYIITTPFFIKNYCFSFYIKSSCSFKIPFCRNYLTCIGWCFYFYCKYYDSKYMNIISLHYLQIDNLLIVKPIRFQKPYRFLVFKLLTINELPQTYRSAYRKVLLNLTKYLHLNLLSPYLNKNRQLKTSRK